MPSLWSWLATCTTRSVTRQATAYNDLVRAGKVDPCLGRTIRFDQLPGAHAAMGRGEDVFGNVVALVGASEAGTGRAH